jgi:hypothetical protein
MPENSARLPPDGAKAAFGKTVFMVLPRIPGPFILITSVYLSSLPVIPALDGIRLSDKLIHLVCFAGLSGAWCWWFSPESWRAHFVRNALVVIAAVSVYGMLDEFHQAFVPGREVSLLDWLCDTGGALAGALAGGFLTRLFARQPGKAAAYGSAD